MDTLLFNTEKTYGEFKKLNCVNNAPVHKRRSRDQLRDNLEAYKAARIPFARNHDAALYNVYGGEFANDISAIFPNFDADADNPDSYDFDCTDEYIKVLHDADTEIFFRLGQKIEHEVRKHHTLPPKDFNKWADICEHIIRHYTEGWANGYSYDIKYWEIWNEPDLDADDSPNKRCWGGTAAEFYDLYETTAKKLKARFPHLKIGGPALAGSTVWAEKFLAEMQKRNAPIDFFSWHCYGKLPETMLNKWKTLEEHLNKYGYGDAESICNEWNYVKGWSDDFVYSIRSIIGLKGASFILAAYALAQPSTIDMLMYYDARPCVFNGLFDFYTLDTLPGYYPFYWYGTFYDGYSEIRAKNTVDNVYALCGKSSDGKVRCMLTYYSEDDESPEKELLLDFGRSAKYRVYTLSGRNQPTEETVDSLKFKLKVHTCLLIEEI